jgi:hypothetical protein
MADQERVEPGPVEQVEESGEEAIRGSGSMPVAQATPIAWDQTPEPPAGLIAQPLSSTTLAATPAAEAPENPTD